MAKESGEPHDVFSKHTRKLDEVPTREIKRQMITAYVLRNAVVDSKTRPYDKHPLPGVQLIVIPSPRENNIELDIKLINNVRVRCLDDNKKVTYRKLLDSELELLRSVNLFRDDYTSCYSTDQKMQSLPQRINCYAEVYQKNGLGRLVSKLKFPDTKYQTD